MHSNSLDVLFPISLVIGGVFMVSFSQFLSYRNRKRALVIMEEALKNNASLDHKTLETIAWAKPRPFADFRRGCLFLALALSVFIVSFSIANTELRSVLRAISMLPAVLGLTYLFFHFKTPQTNSAN